MTTEIDRFAAPAFARQGVYLANPACGLASAPVLDAVTDYLRREAEIGSAAAVAEARGRIDAGYAAAAQLIGAHVDEVAFVDSGNRALQVLIQSAALVAGDHVLVDRTCWGGTLDMLTSLKDVVVDVMPVDRHGRADPVATRAMVHPRTRLIILTWCPATAGVVNPAEAIGAVAADLGLFYIVDACQLLGQRPVDVAALRCHGLAASGRKWLRGPRGTALLYASRDYVARTEAYMADQIGRRRSDARRYESGEASIAGRIGLGVAIEGALAIGVTTIAEHVSAMAGLLRSRLGATAGVTLVDTGDDLSAIVAFVVDGYTPAEVAGHLQAGGITVGTLDTVYAPFDMAARGLTEVIRAAPQIYNDAGDIERLVSALTALIAADAA